jgi:hypothetical protein
MKTKKYLGSCKQVPIDLVELEGPYECPHCGYHVMLDATHLDQVVERAACPNPDCKRISRVVDETNNKELSDYLFR